MSWASLAHPGSTSQSCSGACRCPGCWVLTGRPFPAQEVLENLKDRWYQADNPPSDLLLTEDEFLSFLHPEHSRGMLKFMVKEIVRDLGEAWPVAHPEGVVRLRVLVPPCWWLGWMAGSVVHLQPVVLAAVALGVWRLCGYTAVRDGQALSCTIWPPLGS